MTEVFWRGSSQMPNLSHRLCRAKVAGGGTLAPGWYHFGLATAAA